MLCCKWDFVIYVGMSIRVIVLKYNIKIIIYYCFIEGKSENFLLNLVMVIVFFFICFN